MAVTDSLTQTLGIVEKAKIRIIQKDVGEGKDSVASDDSPVSTGSDSVIRVMSATPMESGEASLLVKNISASALRRAENVLTEGISAAVKRPAPVFPEMVFTVQFNPGKLRLSGHGGGLYQKTNYGVSTKGGEEKGSGSVSFEKAKARIEMQVPLIFDQTVNTDAFFFDKFLFSPSNVVKGVVQAGMKAAGKLNYSVQPVVEAFIAMLRQESTRYVEFCWGTLVYRGIVNRISASYTMFSVSGQPVRATVELSMVLADEGVSESNMGDWQKHYEAAFTGGSFSLVSASQKAGSLLNF